MYYLILNQIFHTAILGQDGGSIS